MDVGMGWWRKWKPVLVMLAIVVAYAVMNIMIKKAIDEGTNRLLLITLRQLIAALILSPIAYFRERSVPRCSAALTQYLFLLGLQYTSATFACAFANILPVLTFLMALLFRLETLNLKRTAGIAKAVGAAVCIAGAMLLSLYKGVALTSSPHRSGASEPRPTHLAVDYTSRQCLMATVALFAACLCYSSWFLVQSKVGKKYPALYSGAALVFLISFLQAAALSLAIQRSLSTWVLKTKLELITVLYSVSNPIHSKSLTYSRLRSPSIVAGDSGIRDRVLGHVMVRGEKRSTVHRCIHSSHTDHRGRHRHLRPP
ncbi:hypothetical protein BHE74_00053985 [Ensete ventricosum]|nr:hypothetical protein BHE74_00053985 [Ensete ventricosum]